MGISLEAYIVWSLLNVATKQGAGQGPPEGGVARVLSEYG
jgi:hypothetical protein